MELGRSGAGAGEVQVVSIGSFSRETASSHAEPGIEVEAGWFHSTRTPALGHADFRRVGGREFAGRRESSHHVNLAGRGRELQGLALLLGHARHDQVGQ